MFLFSFITKVIRMLENVNKHKENTWIFNVPVPYVCIGKTWYYVTFFSPNNN